MKFPYFLFPLTLWSLSNLTYGESSLDFDPLKANRETHENFSKNSEVKEEAHTSKEESKDELPQKTPTPNSEATSAPQEKGEPLPSENTEVKEAIDEDESPQEATKPSNGPEPSSDVKEKPKPELPSDSEEPLKKNSLSRRSCYSNEDTQIKALNSSGNFVRRIPGQEMFIVLKKTGSKNKAPRFADSLGRFVISQGHFYDMWDQGKELNSPFLIDYAFSHIPLDMIRKFTKTNDLTISPKNSNGNNKGREIFIIGDPEDRHTIELLKDITEHKDAEYYLIRVILVNAKGDTNTENLLRDFACSKATQKEKLKVLLNQDFKLIFKTAEDCTYKDKLKRSQKLLETLGISKLPFLITPNGRFSEGAIHDPFKFIQNRK